MKSLRRKVGSLVAIASLAGAGAIAYAPQAAQADSPVVMSLNSALVLTDTGAPWSGSPNTNGFIPPTVQGCQTSAEAVLATSCGAPWTNGPGYRIVSKAVSISAPAGTFTPNSFLAVTQCDANQAKVTNQTPPQGPGNLCDGRNAQLGAVTGTNLPVGVGPGSAWRTNSTGGLAANTFQVIGGITPTDTRGRMDGFPGLLQNFSPAPAHPIPGRCPSDAANTTVGFDYCVVAETNLQGGFAVTGLPQEFFATPITFASVKSSTQDGTTAWTSGACTTAGGKFAAPNCTVTISRIVPPITSAKTAAKSGTGATFTKISAAGCANAGSSTNGCIVDAPGTFALTDIGRYVTSLTTTSGNCTESGASQQAQIINVVGSGTRAFLSKDVSAFGANCTTSGPEAGTAWSLAPYWDVTVSGVGFGSGGAANFGGGTGSGQNEVGGRAVGFEAVGAAITDSVTTCVPRSFDPDGNGSGRTAPTNADGSVTLSFRLFSTCLAGTQTIKVTLIGATDVQINQAVSGTSGSVFGVNSLRKSAVVTRVLGN